MERLTSGDVKEKYWPYWGLVSLTSSAGSNSDALICLLLQDSSLRIHKWDAGQDPVLNTLIWKERVILMILSYTC